MNDFRIGHGYDVHAFCEGDHLMLGGVRIDYAKGFKAHSDGDVLVHAICDALLGALALGDIGKHFPDTDDAFAGIESLLLLKDVYATVRREGWLLSNLDCTIIAQTPVMSPHVYSMRQEIAIALKSEINQVSVKATTTEKLGFEGRSEGIAAEAVVLLKK